MRCQDCNVNLTDEESTRKNEKTGQYWDLCNNCLSNFYKDIDVDIPTDMLDDNSSDGAWIARNSGTNDGS